MYSPTCDDTEGVLELPSQVNNSEDDIKLSK